MGKYGTAAEYRRALAALDARGLPPKHKQLAAAAGYTRPNITFSQYGRLGTIVAEALGHEQEYVRTRVLADDFRVEDGSVAWRMEPALAQALVSLGWADLATGTSLVEDILNFSVGPEVPETQREALIQSRVGQGPFRQALLRTWRACAVTGISEPSVLRASHIKPWKDSANHERLDAANGLLLAAHLDALFDAGLITFDEKGRLVVSAALPREERRRLGLRPGMRLSNLTPGHQKYLDFHRRRVWVDRNDPTNEGTRS